MVPPGSGISSGPSASHRWAAARMVPSPPRTIITSNPLSVASSKARSTPLPTTSQTCTGSTSAGSRTLRRAPRVETSQLPLEVFRRTPIRSERRSRSDGIMARDETALQAGFDLSAPGTERTSVATATAEAGCRICARPVVEKAAGEAVGRDRRHASPRRDDGPDAPRRVRTMGAVLQLPVTSRRLAVPVEGAFGGP